MEMKKRIFILIVSLFIGTLELIGQVCTLTGPISTNNVCPGGTVILTVVVDAGLTNVTYQWQYSSDNTTYNNVSVDAPSGITYTGPATASLTITGNGFESTGNNYYHCIVTSAECGSVTSDVATVTVNPVPIALALTGSEICVSPGGNGTITSPTSENGVSYQLYDGSDATVGTSKTGDGLGQTWTGLSAGTGYYVIGSDGTCESTSNTVDITTKANPVALALTGSVICATPGGNGTITSPTSENGVSYQLYDGSDATVGTSKTGDGSGQTWTGLSAGTGYYVIGTSGTCDSPSSNTVDVVINTALTLSGSEICASPGGNGTITSTSSISGVSYQLYDGSDATVGTPKTGDGSGQTWTGLSAGIGYYVIGTSGTCDSPSSNTVDVIAQPDNASNVTFTGNMTVGSTLTAHYDFSSTACFPNDRSQTQYTWYRDNNASHGTCYVIAQPAPGDSTVVLPLEAYDNFLMVKVEIFNGTDYQTAVEGTWTTVIVAANSKPVASNIAITGDALVGQTLTGSYDYTDAENDPQATADYEWLKSLSSSGSSFVAIGGSNSSTYVLQSTDAGYYIGLRVTPKATTPATALTGDPAIMEADWFGQIVSNAPVASNVKVIGDPKSGTVVYGYYLYSDVEDDPEGTSIYQWYYAEDEDGANMNIIAGANSVTYKISDTYLVNPNRYIGFEVTPVSSSGNPNTGATVLSPKFIGPVTNAVPVASNVSISGPSPLNVNDILTGNYTFYDPEGDLEGTSTYEWLRDVDNNITGAVSTGITTRTYQVSLADTGKYLFFRVTPKAATGNLSGGATEASSASSRANTPPYAIKKPIIYTTFVVGSVLTGDYEYRDHDLNPQGTSTFRWLRDGTTPIPGATAITYSVDLDDEGHTLVFEVTPVSSVGYPNTGTSVPSDPTIVVPGASKPEAKQVCIQGKRKLGEVITGKYFYDFPKAEGASTYQWYRGEDAITSLANGITYTLTEADLTEDIKFEVKPKSVIPEKEGTPVTSKSLARITISQVSYPHNADTVTLAAVPTEPGVGVFSGPGVTDGKFIPSTLEPSVVPYPVKYIYYENNSFTTCVSEHVKNFTITASSTEFNSPKDTMCYNDDAMWIDVDAVPEYAIPHTYSVDYVTYGYDYGFYMNSPYWKGTNNTNIGIVDEDLTNSPYNPSGAKWRVKIDPKLLRPGYAGYRVYYLYLYYYLFNGSYNVYYQIRLPIIVEEVSGVTEISNLKAEYCHADLVSSIQAYGLYPSGGSALWTGDILTDKTSLIAKINPGSGDEHGAQYPVTYQYTSKAGCKSNLFPTTVKVNPMPDASFSINPLYDLNGDATELVPDVAPGTGYDASFIGPGVIKIEESPGIFVFKFLPGIVDEGPKTLAYKVTTDRGCYAESTESTYVEKATGTFNGISSKECYSDDTLTVSISDLPDDTYSCDPVDFWNKNKTLEWTAGLSGQYNIAAARAGYDTLYFTYSKRNVDFTIKKPVYIDSIGNITISGLKDEYCDYEGLATVRALVENSTGAGSFTFTGPASALTNYLGYAVFDPTKVTTGTQYYVRYTHVSAVNNSGCTKTDSIPVTVNLRPSVSIATDRITVNIKEAPVVLSGSPSDGIFSGRGVYKSGSDYVFDPDVAGLGDAEFSLSYTDIKGCSVTKKDTLTVAAASGSILGLNPNNQYCYDGLKDTLTYSSSKPWTNGSFSGPGITDLGSAKAVFDPASAGKGDHDLVFNYYDSYGTLFDVSAKVNVDSLGVVEIKPIAAGDEYCNNDAPFELITTPKGGVFTGPVTTGNLNPSKALGDTAVTYTYLNVKTGCTITGRVPFTIHPAPVVSFVPSDICIENKYDSIRFINNTISADAVSDWLWTFSDLGGTDLSGKQSPAYLFKSGGQHLITLTATTVNSCVVRKDLTIDLGVKPVADFYWKNECYLAGDSLILFDNTVSTSAIVSRSWNFFDGAPLKTGTELKYPKNAVGLIPVQYIVMTAYENCSDTVTKNIYIRPNIIIPSDGYFEDFESGDGGWSKGDESINSWSFGTPDRSKIKSASSGSAAWFTRFDSVVVESSSVISPCYDFSVIERPMISLGLMKNFNKDRDGAALQYRIGDSGTWQYIGSVDDGINWYNSTFIKGRPGGDQMGWTTALLDPRWLEASHTLDELKGKKDVKLRIAYGSDGNAQDNDGLAFDDVFIGERKRNVLLEHFTNNSSLRSSEATAMINAADIANDKDIVNIQYHTNFPGVDSFYVDNPGDASARILFYGLTKAPYAFIDGGTRVKFDETFDFSSVNPDGSLAPINSYDIIRRGLISPFFAIRLDSLVVSGGVLTVTGDITGLETDTLSNLTLYLAVVEKTNTKYTGAAGETLFRNVFRKFIPDAAGISLPSIWNRGVKVPIQDQTWIIQKTLNSSDIEVIAFIQNSVTKEVYQAASMLKPKITVGIEKPGILNNIDFALYPNPAKHQLTIRFGEPLERSTDIFIYDFGGMIVKTFKAWSGETEFTIDDLGLKDGIYLIRVSYGGVNYGFKKLIITGS